MRAVRFGTTRRALERKGQGLSIQRARHGAWHLWRGFSLSTSPPQPRHWPARSNVGPVHADYDNYLQFFKDTVAMVGPIMASDNPNLAPFRDRGGKVVMWHGFADQLIVPEGTIDYYDAVTQALGGGYKRTQEFARLFMAPGVGHCGGGNGPQPQALFDAVVNWVEHDQAPETILATKSAGSKKAPMTAAKMPLRLMPQCASPIPLPRISPPISEANFIARYHSVA